MSARLRGYRLAMMLGIALVMMTIPAYGQGGATTTSLTGVVVDASGGVVPGVDVVAKNNATAGVFSAVSNETGTFVIPALDPGMYTVTVSLMGFKTVVLPDVQLITAQPAKVKVTLLVGELSETVTVSGATEILQTESAAISTTLSTKQISTVPMSARSALDFVASLPGVDSTSTVRNSTVMGLQPSAINITIDGFNVQDNFYKSSSGQAFFARMFPRMDAVEEITVSTANAGAESAGQGAVQIRFVTRSGTNTLQGSAYEYARRTRFNSNYWFNKQQGLPNTEMNMDTFGVRIGGPAKKDKLFFFFNFEELWNPASVSRQRTMLTPQAGTGQFTWSGGPAGGVNLLALAGANGQVATIDPTVSRLLQDLQTAAGQGTIQSTGTPITQYLNFTVPYDNYHPMPTLRLDYNISRDHRVGTSVYFQAARTNPDASNNYDAKFPGFPGAANRVSNRWSVMGNWRWTVSPVMVNEVRWGWTGGPYKFGDGFTNEVFHTGQFEGWNGFALYPSTSLISQMYGALRPTMRDAPNKFVESTLNWLKGSHSISAGFSFTRVPVQITARTAAAQLGFGVESYDPANALFTTTNLPGASSTDLANARALYALLTGRINSVTGNAYLNGTTGKYAYLGDVNQSTAESETGAFIQDSWKIRPNLTLSYGVRYELQLPFVMSNSSYSRPLDYCNTFGISGCAGSSLNPNLFAPGSVLGSATQFQMFGEGESAYNTDWNNVAPSVGIAWRPHLAGKGWLTALLSSDPVVRSGYSKSYIREGLMAVTSMFGNNPGMFYTAARSMSLGNLVGSASELPLLLRNGFSQFGPAAFPDSPTYPLTPSTSNGANEFYPDARTPYAHSFSASFQRSITKNTAVDIRYVGTRNNGGWWVSSGGRNLNEYNLIENGFLNEFKLAQANLAANVAAGMGATFAYTGAGGTSPLPATLAYLTGSKESGNPSSYSGTAWKNSTLYGYLSKHNPQPLPFATYLQTNNSTFAANAINAGLPANYFLLNPGLYSGAYVMGRPEDSINNRYDAIQVELKRRMSKGFLIQGSYQWVMRSQTTNFYTLRQEGEWVDTGIAHHALKANWVFELPFGRNRKWGTDAGTGLNALIGGWSWNGYMRLQSGNILDFGNVRLVGMSDQELQKAFKVRKESGSDGVEHVYMLPADIIQNSIKAFSTDPTSATGYGSLGAPGGRYFAPASSANCVNGYIGQCSGDRPLHHYVTGPLFFRVDMTLAKRIDLTKRVWSDLRVDVFNVFDAINYIGATMTSPYTSTSAYEVTSAFTDGSTYDPGGRLLQLSFRVSF
jgi:hypothetical protein